MKPLPEEPKPFEKFRAAMKQILAVSKEEIERREAEYKKQQAEKRNNRKPV
jgi:hypothetical protein